MPPARTTEDRPAGPGRFRQDAWLKRPASRIAIAFILYLAVRWLVLGGIDPVHFSDSQSYIDQYRNGFSGGFFFRPRSWCYPLLFRLCGHHLAPVVVVQRLAGALAWFALALSAAGLFRLTAARRVAFWGTLLVSLTLYSVMWDAMLLSESLSNSLFIATIAAWVCFLRSTGAGLRPLALLVALAIPFAGLRGTNVLLLYAFAVCAALALGMRFFRGPEPRPPRRDFWAGLGLAAILLLVSLGHSYEVKACHRNWESIGGVFSMRIFLQPVRTVGGFTIGPNEENINWLAKRYGLPAEDARARAGKRVYAPPPLSPAYETWLKQTGPRALLGFMRHHPGWVLATFNGSPIYHRMDAGLPYLEPQDAWHKARLGLPRVIQHMIHLTLDRLLAIPWINTLLSLAAAGLGLAWLVRGWRGGGLGEGSRRLAVMFWLFATAALMLFISVFGDFYEAWRHAITGLLALYAAVPLGLAMLVEALFTRSRSVRAAQTTPAAPDRPARRTRPR